MRKVGSFHTYLPCLLHSYPLPATRGCHLPPEAMHPLKGKPETGMDAADIYPKLTIRFPNAAPFDCWISLFHQASEPPGLLCVPHVPLPPCPHVPSRPMVAHRQLLVQRSNGTA